MDVEIKTRERSSPHHEDGMLVRQFGKQAGPLEPLVVCVSLCLSLGAPSLKALGGRSAWAAAFPNCHSASQTESHTKICSQGRRKKTQQGMCWAKRLLLSRSAGLRGAPPACLIWNELLPSAYCS